MNEESAEQPRVQSAHVHNDRRRKPPSKSPTRRSRYLNRPKSTSVQRSSPLVKHFSFRKTNSFYLFFSIKATSAFSNQTFRFFIITSALSNHHGLLWSTYQS